MLLARDIAISILVSGVLLLGMAPANPKEVSFQTPDSGAVFADVYGTGDRAVILAHGVRFNKESWKDQATQLANSGFRVIAIDFRGYGKSRGGPNARSGFDDMYMDVLGAVRYARETGAKTVAVVGGSMGGSASANAVVTANPARSIDSCCWPIRQS